MAPRPKAQKRDIRVIKENWLYIMGYWGTPEKLSLFGYNQFQRLVYIQDIPEHEIDNMWKQAEEITKKYDRVTWFLK